MTWIISKDFEFAYGHRVHTQVLDGKYAADLKAACRHLHGHEGRVQVMLTGDGLNESGMITDFRHLEWLKKWINQYVDHQFILDRNDPLYKSMIGVRDLIPVIVPDTDYFAGWRIDLTGVPLDTPEYEYLEGFLIVEFVPTSEKLSQWMADIVEAKMCSLGVSVKQINWWETPKSCSTYIRKGE